MGDEQKNIQKKVDISRYEDIEGLSSKKIKYGLWYVEHLKLFNNMGMVFLIIISTITWGWFFYAFGNYLIYGMADDELIIKGITQLKGVSHQQILSRLPQDINYGSPNFLSTGDSKYDFFTQIKNINEKHWGVFDYYYLSGQEKTETLQGFILPGESKYIAALSQELRRKPNNIQLVVENLTWYRIDPRKIKDWNKFKNERINFPVSDIIFTPAAQTELSERINLNKISFVAENKTAFNYWEVNFSIFLYRQGDIIGVNRYTAMEFLSGEKRLIELSWPGNLGRSEKIDIIPEINIMNEGLYMEYEERLIPGILEEEED